MADKKTPPKEPVEKVPGPLIFKLIPKIMEKVWVVGKSRTNTQQGYKFRGIDDMYNALNSHLSENGVFITSEILSEEREERQTRNNWVLIYSILKVKFTFFAPDGSSVFSIMIWEAMDSGDKSMNKAMSVAYKYALMQIFCIPTEEEKDTEYQTHDIKPKEPVKAPTPTPPVPKKVTPEEQKKLNDWYAARLKECTEITVLQTLWTEIYNDRANLGEYFKSLEIEKNKLKTALTPPPAPIKKSVMKISDIETLLKKAEELQIAELPEILKLAEEKWDVNASIQAEITRRFKK